jgi:uncharacterized LabA/DUF88 family protein
LQRLLDRRPVPCDTVFILPHGYIPWPPRGCDPGVFPFLEANINRCVFLVDGLNLYHSALDAERVTKRSLRGLDVSALCRSYLHALPGRSDATSVMYFSAVAHHRESRRPGTVTRQVAYFKALEETGVQLHLGQFKAKSQVCPLCGGRFVGWEEKETDVAIGAALLELICKDRCETAVLVTGDTDLVPAIRAARRLDPTKYIVALQPYRRVNRELSRCADRALTIRVASYARHQLPGG